MQSLDQGIQLKIFSALAEQELAQTICALATTCKSWHLAERASTDVIWRIILRKYLSPYSWNSVVEGTRTSEPRPLLRSVYRSLLHLQKGVWVRPKLKVLNGRGVSPRNGAAMCCIKGEALLFGGSLERVQRVARTPNLTNDLHSFRLLPAIAEPEALSEAALLRALQERQAVAPDEPRDKANLVKRAAEAAREPLILTKQLQTASASPSGRWGHSFTAVRLAIPGGGREDAAVVLGGWPGEEVLQPYLLLRCVLGVQLSDPSSEPFSEGTARGIQLASLCA